MLVTPVPEFLAVRAAPDPAAAYHEYLDRHRPVLASYWHNYVLDPGSPHAEQVIAAALGADRADLKRLLADVDVVSIAEDALQRALERFEADCPVDLYLMVGVGAANAGELVVGGRGIAFLCLEHFTGRANPQTYGMGLAPRSEEHTSELQSQSNLVCRLLLEKKNKINTLTSPEAPGGTYQQSLARPYIDHSTQSPDLRAVVHEAYRR